MARLTLGAGGQTHRIERDGGSDTITDFRSTYFLSTLDEAQEVPPNVDIEEIEGTGEGVLNFARTRFDFLLDIDGIDLGGGGGPDDMTDMHIHGAPEGESGDIIFHFLEDTEETEIDAAAGTVTGGWDAEEAAAEAEDMTAANVSALLAGDTYFNIHTNRDTSGFIRGQILKDGGSGDRIDLRDLNIGGFETLQAITSNVSGDARIRAFLDGEDTTLRLDGIAKGALREGHFIFAGSEAETIAGTAGRDDLFGAGGADTLTGRGGRDRLFGENGADRLVGGAALDLLTGAAGGDRFVFAGIGDSGDTAATADRIMDFAGRDRIVLSGIDAVTGTAGNQAFTFIGDDAFDAPGQVGVGGSGDNTIVSLNTTGTGGAEMVIRLAGDITLSEPDFML